MKKLSKNPIDQYFREILKSPDLEYSKQDWKGLEKMLPGKQKKNSSLWWFPASIAAAVALLFVSFWLFNKPLINSEKLAKKQYKVSEKTSAADDDQNKNKSSAFSKRSSSSTAGTTSDYATRNLPKDLSLSRLNLGKSERGDLEKLKETIPDIPGVAPVQLTGSSNSEYEDNFYSGHVNVNTFDLQSPSAADQKAKEKLSDETLHSKFSLGLSLSPDINSISKFSKSSFGNSIGLAVSYQISRRLSINTAVAYSKKVYSAEPYQYKAPWAYSNVGRNAELINADCRVLDIPLNLSYSITKSPKRTLFASAGLSSYLMLKEKYTLIQDSKPSGYPRYPNPSYAYSNKNQHLMSVLNVSAGLSKPIGKQTSLVVEPYMRVPFTGIGQGKVHLQSIGLNLQLKYNFRKRGINKPNPGGAAH